LCKSGSPASGRANNIIKEAATWSDRLEISLRILCHASYDATGVSGASLHNVRDPNYNFHIHTVHLDIIKVFHSRTDAQGNCLKNNFKIYIKIDIKTAPTFFGAFTIIRERIIRAS
jgi:hypothetical protein